MGKGSRVLVWFALLNCLLLQRPLSAQQANQFGKIIGIVRVSRGDFPVHPVLVSLELRGAAVESTYSDDQGRFGFYSLTSNEYRVTANDDAYEPFSETVRVDPTVAPMNFVQMTLVPRSKTKTESQQRVAGSNPYLIDPAEYYRQFPKKTVKEFEKGVTAEKDRKPENAIEHYEKALRLSPDFYPAHNNLGSLYLSQKNFAEAQAQFESALRANQNDGQAHFNLANVLLLTQRHAEAELQIAEGMKRRPDSAFGHFLEGLLYSRTNRPDLAEKSLEHALQLDPTMSQVYLQLVNLYLQQQRTSDAITQLEAYLKAFPNTAFTPKARDLLKRLRENPSASAVP